MLFIQQKTRKFRIKITIMPLRELTHAPYVYGVS